MAKAKKAAKPKEVEAKSENAAAEIAKKITDNAQSGDPFEFDSSDEAKEVFDNLPEGQFILQQGNRTVIQKL